MYRLYLIDFDGEYIELDAEELDFGVEFKISSLSDLSYRSGNRTKEITLKGTEANNNAFGYIYRLGRSTNIDLDNKLFFNYNSLRQVDCLVYRDTNLLFRGTLRLTETVKVKGVIYYKCVLTDSVIDVMKFTQDKTLGDLDFSHLKHQYTIQTITQSWSYQTQRWDGNTYSYTPFEKGSGYAYGYAYYGLTPSPSLLGDSIYNYRPALYVKEIFNAVFSQDGLSGVTWEAKGSSDFIERFNSLVIPNSQDGFYTTLSNYKQTISRCSGYAIGDLRTYYLATGNPIRPTNPNLFALLNLPCNTIVGSDTSISLLQQFGTYSSIFNVMSNIECNAYLTNQYTISFNTSYQTLHIQSQIVERNINSSTSAIDSNWTVVSRDYIIYPISLFPSGIINDSRELLIEKRNWTSGKQIAVRMQVWYVNDDFTPISGPPTIVSATASFSIPHFSNSSFNIELRYGMDVTPQLLPNTSIKQYDFIKSIMLMHNLFAYTEKERPKHIIFQSYDDFYAFSTINNLKISALDWTNKIVYSEDIKKAYNLNIPKRYIYTYKEDKDYINADYKTSFNDVYGKLKFNDEYGVTDENKIDIIFSPSPLTRISGDLFCTQIRGGDDLELKTTSSNIRILYFNGYIPASDYTYLYGTYSTVVRGYGEMVEYYRSDLQYSTTSPQFLNSIQFGLPLKYYFPSSNFYSNLPNLYSTYYINRVSELTDVDLHTIECKMILNNVDIATFDFRVPIYISTDMGNSYYKVLEISWKDEKTPATVRLQSINISKV